ncbi:MAG: glycosyltransferase family 4 protein, partial [Thermoflexales bacterium]|nr:glycosyltransferase family 4 protein [Thermoflexales bacterium]
IDASRVLAPRLTGTERYARAVIEALVPLLSAHRVRLYFRDDPEGWRVCAPHVEQCWIRQPRLWTHWGLWRELRARPPQALFVPAHVLPFVPLPPMRRVVVVHDVGYRYFPRAHLLGQRLYLELGTWLSVRLADVVIADSHATRADVLRFYRVPLDKVRVAHPGVPPLAAVNEATADAVLSRYGLRPRSYVLHVGTLQPRKNLHRLVAAWARLSEAAALELVLAGAQGWGAVDRALCRAPRVRCLGYVSDVEKSALLRNALAVVIPSLHEGFGFPVLEAHAAGTPLACSRRAALPEVAGDAALYFDPEDVEAMRAALARLVTDAALRAQLVAAGQANLQRFSWQRCAAVIAEALLGGAAP